MPLPPWPCGPTPRHGAGGSSGSSGSRLAMSPRQQRRDAARRSARAGSSPDAACAASVEHGRRPARSDHQSVARGCGSMSCTLAQRGQVGSADRAGDQQDAGLRADWRRIRSPRRAAGRRCGRRPARADARRRPTAWLSPAQAAQQRHCHRKTPSRQRRRCRSTGSRGTCPSRASPSRPARRRRPPRGT